MFFLKVHEAPRESKSSPRAMILEMSSLERSQHQAFHRRWRQVRRRAGACAAGLGPPTRSRCGISRRRACSSMIFSALAPVTSWSCCQAWLRCWRRSHQRWPLFRPVWDPFIFILSCIWHIEPISLSLSSAFRFPNLGLQLWHFSLITIYGSILSFLLHPVKVLASCTCTRVSQ